jgi:hypothetical protein
VSGRCASPVAAASLEVTTAIACERAGSAGLWADPRGYIVRPQLRGLEQGLLCPSIRPLQMEPVQRTPVLLTLSNRDDSLYVDVESDGETGAFGEVALAREGDGRHRERLSTRQQPSNEEHSAC